MTASPQKPSTSEWLRVMVEEVERKRDEAARARLEQDRRAAERGGAAGASRDESGTPPGRGRPSRKTSR